MKIVRLLVGFLFFAALPQFGNANVCVYKPPKVRQIHGRVVDSSNAPIPGAIVTLTMRDKTSDKVQTGDKGEFSFDSRSMRLPQGSKVLVTLWSSAIRQAIGIAHYESSSPSDRLSAKGPSKSCDKAN